MARRIQGRLGQRPVAWSIGGLWSLRRGRQGTRPDEEGDREGRRTGQSQSPRRFQQPSPPTTSLRAGFGGQILDVFSAGGGFDGCPLFRKQRLDRFGRHLAQQLGGAGPDRIHLGSERGIGSHQGRDPTHFIGRKFAQRESRQFGRIWIQVHGFLRVHAIRDPSSRPSGRSRASICRRRVLSAVCSRNPTFPTLREVTAEISS